MTAAPLTLALETSCDDTCAAVIVGGDRDRGRAGEILANVISSQREHDRFGGVVPEIAAREHLDAIGPIVTAALSDANVTLDQIEEVAVTAGPGLIGCLLVGVSAAKAIATARRLPLVAVDHLHGHICANLLDPDPARLPLVCLVASGGHTFLAAVREPGSYTVLGTTLDDAAGEAIDKGARMLGLPFPGGPHLQRLAADGDERAFELPTAQRLGGIDFSFAGLKTALLYTIRDLGERESQRRAADLAASYQHAAIEQLAQRSERALAATGIERLALGGGVAANEPLRARLAQIGVELHVPPHELCTDNAAMIAAAARFTVALSEHQALTLEPYATGNRRAIGGGS